MQYTLLDKHVIRLTGGFVCDSIYLMTYFIQWPPVQHDLLTIRSTLLCN